jgi:hypothetical protein
MGRSEAARGLDSMIRSYAVRYLRPDTQSVGLSWCLYSRNKNLSSRGSRKRASSTDLPFESATGTRYVPFFPLNFAQRARCASAIRLRAAAESLRLPGLPPPALPPTTPLNAAIARSSFARSSFNCSNTAPRSVIWSSLVEIRTAFVESNDTGWIARASLSHVTQLTDWLVRF